MSIMEPEIEDMRLHAGLLEETLGATRHERLLAAADDLRALLGRGNLWHINSTSAGGGVAEMLHTLIPLYRALGVPARWGVTAGDGVNFTLTKRLGDALYGSATVRPWTTAEHRSHEEASRPTADALTELLREDDAVVLHDHQTASLAPAVSAAGAAPFWRCHVGVEEPTAATRWAWGLVTPWLQHCQALLFSSARLVPAVLHGTGTAQVLPPFIWPHSDKNRDLAPGESAALLQEVKEHVSAGPTTDLDRGEGASSRPGGPLLLQISRWDRLKDMPGLLTAFATDGAPGHLLLVGPDPHGIADDPDQAVEYERCRTAFEALPARAQHRVTLAVLPLTDTGRNARWVNALQRAADVVIQRSLAEGFGLTVTEAMWKERVVVASAVGGMQDQITHGRSGYLLPAPDTRAALSSTLTEAASLPAQAAAVMGRQARQTVLDRYLPDQEVLHFASHLNRLRGSAA